MTSPSLTLRYFAIHGMAARIRLAALVGGVPLEDHRLSRSDFDELRAAGKLPYGQVPLLEIRSADGAVTYLPQSGAILRYVCALGSLHPTDAVKAAVVDAALDAERDCFAGYVAAKYRERFGFDGLSPEAVAAVQAAQRSVVVPKHLAHLEQQLAGSASGWVAGTAAPSAADFAWGTQLRELRDGLMTDREGTVLFSVAETMPEAAYPAVHAFLGRFLALPPVASYYAQWA